MTISEIFIGVVFFIILVTSWQILLENIIGPSIPFDDPIITHSNIKTLHRKKYYA